MIISREKAEIKMPDCGKELRLTPWEAAQVTAWPGLSVTHCHGEILCTLLSTPQLLAQASFRQCRSEMLALLQDITPLPIRQLDTGMQKRRSSSINYFQWTSTMELCCLLYINFTTLMGNKISLRFQKLGHSYTSYKKRGQNLLTSEEAGLMWHWPIGAHLSPLAPGPPGPGYDRMM